MSVCAYVCVHVCMCVVCEIMNVKKTIDRTWGTYTCILILSVARLLSKWPS